MTLETAMQERDRMMEEMNAQVVSSLGFTHSQLLDAFNVLTKNMENWKEPIQSFIRKDELEIMREACSYFTSSSLEVALDKGGLLLVYADGYYIAVGA